MPGAAAWSPELIQIARVRELLAAIQELRLLTTAESGEVLHLLGPDCPFFASVRLASSLHLHVKVDDVAALPASQLEALGASVENARDGYVKYCFAGGLNFIASSIPIAEEDTLPSSRVKPFLDHVGVDLRRETGMVKARFDEIPSVAQRIGWAHVRQGGRGRAVHCCHTHVAEKHWVYPLSAIEGQGTEGFSRPLEVAYGPLEVSAEVSGCDLRPIDPRHPAAPDFVAC